MLYQAIAAGSKGVLLYSYHNGNVGADSDVNLWNGIKSTVPEIEKIKDFLTDGIFSRSELGQGLYASTWTYQGKCLVIVVHAGDYRSHFNPAQNAADRRKVSLTLPAGVSGTLRPAFTARPTGMNLINGKLEGDIDLLDVHAYIIEANPPTVTIASTDATASEPSDVGIFTVSRSEVTTSPLTIALSVGGSAVSGSDYSAISSSVTIAANQASATVTVTPIDDSATESTETVVLSLAGGSDYLIGGASSATVTIADNDSLHGGTGLTGTYFSDMNFGNAVVTRTDTTVDFDWGTGSPASGVAADGFSVRWNGQVQAQFSETYTLSTVSDDGVRLWVNGQLVIDNWSDHAPTENSGSITLVAGQKYELKMEFYENGGGAVAKLSWASPSTATQIIPTTQLFPSAPGALPAGWTAQDVGGVAVGGSTTHSNGTWTVSGSGADIWANADGCRFASKRVTGDVQVTAQVSGLTNTNVWAKAGVMIRESLTTGSRHDSTFATAANGLAYQRRLTTGGVSSHTAGPGIPTPYWVHIERLGNVVISSTSPNGTTWTEIRRETFVMSAAVYVGLAVTSHNNGVLCTATFTNVQVVGVAAAAN